MIDAKSQHTLQMNRGILARFHATNDNACWHRVANPSEREVTVNDLGGGTGAPGEIRTPDLQLRSVNKEAFNPWPALLFCALQTRYSQNFA